MELDKKDFENSKSSCCSFVNFEEEEGKAENDSISQSLSSLSEEEWNILLRKQISELEPNERRRIEVSLKKGIDCQLRNNIWLYLVNVDKLSYNFSLNLYQKYLKEKNTLAERNINKDIERTFAILRGTDKLKERSTEQIKELKTKLYNILKVYANFDREIGYAQGTNFIVLMIILNIHLEIDSFWLFMDVMVYKNWKEIYKKDSNTLMTLLTTLKKKIKSNIPLLYEHFQTKKVKYFIMFSFGNTFLGLYLPFLRPFLFMSLPLSTVKEYSTYSYSTRKMQ